jgi:hypothetical protein
MNFLSDNENQTKYNIDTSKIVVCGYSFGGTIAIESGMYIKKVKNIISIANDDHSVSLKKVLNDNKFREEYIGFIGKYFGSSGPFRADLKATMEYCTANIDRYDLVKNAEKLKSKKLLLIIGWQDNTSYLEINTLPLYRGLLKFNKENTTIKGFESDHSFSNVTDEVSKTIINWILDNTK